MAIKLNSNAPTSARYHEQALGAIHDLSMIRYNGDVVWQAAAITAPTNLRVNGSTSSTSSACKLTWTAATLSGATGTITYYIYKNGSQVATTTSTSYTFSTSTITGWSGVSIKVRAYNSSAGYSAYTSAVTFTYKVSSTKVTVAASKYATSDNSSLANTGGTSCSVGRATSSSVVGTAMKFNAPSGGWSQYSKATLYVQRTGGSASANVKIGKLHVPYSNTLYCTEFYHGQYANNIGSVDVAGNTGWFSINISSYLPSSGELGITLMSKNAYIVVDGTNAYIQLSA